ncbi:hypothetical protein [Streptomyces sp. NPDC093591]|uniref:hypothetical protein n=1 Tax=Streptomyces sp. NPDC093591 TaxID=3366044 RepID=UPI00381F020C
MRPRLATLAPCSPNATNQQSQLWSKPYPAVTVRERPTGELLRRRDAVLQRSPDARDALRLDGEATGGYRIRCTEEAQEQLRQQYFRRQMGMVQWVVSREVLV